MRGKRVKLASFVAPLAVLALTSVGCVDERIVYEERELFETPPAAAASFIGYSDEEAKLSVCGNCHVGQQTRWVQTAHADAWDGLVDSGHAQEFCEECHTVSELGNAIEGEVGYTSTGDSRYHDVQCESCHGPGLGHVTNPEGLIPLAALDVSMDLQTGCAECHQGAHHPFVEEWSQSAHAMVPNQGYAGGRTGCDVCHTGEEALRSWGVDVVYEEKAEVEGNTSQHLAITCGVCHDPHADKHEGQLRFAVDVPDEELNLCMKCHHKRGTPDPTTFRGPHSPEGPVVLGYGGWWPPNLGAEGGAIVATHGSEANPRLCAGCHVNSYEVTDATGSFVQTATGHLFNAIPCLDAQGVPTNSHDCAPTERDYSSCTGAGCHGSETVARSLQVTAETRLEFLAEELDRLLSQIRPNWNTCRTNNSCGAGSPWNTADGVYTTAEGAAFNYELALYPGSAIHNPFLLEALLTSTIRQVKLDYGVAVREGVVLENILGK